MKLILPIENKGFIDIMQDDKLHKQNPYGLHMTIDSIILSIALNCSVYYGKFYK